MPEDSGKKKFIKDFLQGIQAGEGRNDATWIERIVRPPGVNGEGSTARSLSGRPITTLTELIEDDLRHCFEDGYFTFRFVAALVGSGKTSLLAYLHETAKTQPNHQTLSIINRFSLSDSLRITGGQSFGIKLYCDILAHTFWDLLHAENLEIRNIANQLLHDYLEAFEASQLVTISRLKQFRAKFNRYFSNSGVIFEDLFFEITDEVTKIEPRFTFVYLIDELDALEEFPESIRETRSLLKALIKRVHQEFNAKIRIFIYFAGTSENIDSFIKQDSVIESLVGKLVINLNKGSSNELELIRAKIDDRIKGAFHGYRNFDAAWKSIKNIPLNSAKSLRYFYQEYVAEVLAIHEKYFSEEPEKCFEGDARALIESQCRQKWGKYLSQKAYTLSSVSTTTIKQGHAFDCYLELIHNGQKVACCYGEAKNYELLSSHLGTLKQWLTDVHFEPYRKDNTPADLAFMIAPSCPSLLQKKLMLENINFLAADKKTQNIENSKNINKIPETLSININTNDKDLLIAAFKGTGVRKTTISKLLDRSSQKAYKNLAELITDLNLSTKVSNKLQQKLQAGKICFQ